MKILKNRFFWLILVFVAAIALFLLLSLRRSQNKVSMEPQVEDTRTLPGLWVKFNGMNINPMSGYKDEVSNHASDLLLSLVDDSLELELFTDNPGEVTAVGYEIRDSENRELIDKQTLEGGIGGEFRLKFSSIISQNREYLLDIFFIIAGEKYHYFTRLMRTDTALAAEILNLTTGFSEKNFNYETARENTTYIESDDSMDNSSLSYVNLKSSYAMLTYNGLGLTPEEDKSIRLVNFDGDTGEVHINFLAAKNTEDSQTNYRIDENFVVRKGERRFYMLDYTRRMREIYEGGGLGTDRILLGIGNDQSSIKRDMENGLLLFTAGDNLFFGNLNQGSVEKVFSGNETLRALPLSIDTAEGAYLVYGHETAGTNAGQVGVRLYRYLPEENQSQCMLYIPLTMDFDILEENVKQLSYLGENNTLYIKLLNKVFGIDLTTGYYSTVADGLQDDYYSVSKDGSALAWHIGEGCQLMNLNTGDSKELAAESGEIILPKGFVENDLVAAIAQEADQNMVNEKSIGWMFSKVKIVDLDLVTHKEYTKEGYYLNNIYTEGGRVHLDYYGYNGSSYDLAGQDTILSNKTGDEKNSVLSYIDPQRARVYYVNTAEASPGEDRKVLLPEQKQPEILTAQLPVDMDFLQTRFYAYAQGRMVQSFEKPQDAIWRIYPDMGFVKRNAQMVYQRASVKNSINLDFKPEEAQEYLDAREEDRLLFLQGISLRQALFLLNIKKPLLAYLASDHPAILFGYDRNNLTLYDIPSASVQKIRIEDGEAAFGAAGNDFSCFFDF